MTKLLAQLYYIEREIKIPSHLLRSYMVKNKTVFYILSFTWGIIISLLGIIVFLVLFIIKGKPKSYNHCYYYEIGNNWGGLEFGWFYLVNNNSSVHIKNHELGHGIQNCYYGPLFVFLWFASIIRYQYRNIIKKIKPNKELPLYDSAWWEGQATSFGTKQIEKFGE